MTKGTATMTEILRCSRCEGKPDCHAGKQTIVSTDRLAAVISAILTDRHGKQITARLRDENSGKNYHGCGGAQHCSGRDGA